MTAARPGAAPARSGAERLRIFGAVAEEMRTSSWVPGLVAIAFATGFVHYLLDRNVFRMSDPRVRAAARGLLDRPRM